MDDISLLVDVAVSTAERDNGVRVGSRSRTVKTMVWNPDDVSSYGAAWSAEDIEFLESMIGILSDEEIAQVLGRSANAIKIIRIRKGMPAHSKRPGYMTGNKVAWALGVDIHSITELVKRGLIWMDTLPGVRAILNMTRQDFMSWALDPENWVYYRPWKWKMRDLVLREKLAKAMVLWPDAWWTTKQASDHFGLMSVEPINKRLRMGTLPGKRWGNWYVKRSDVLKLKIKSHRRKGRGV